MRQFLYENTPAILTAFEGFIDVVSNQRVTGWVWDKSTPAKRQNVIVRLGEEELANVCARVYRRDLKDAGIGDGAYSFDIYLQRPLANDLLQSIVVAVAGTDYLVPISATAIQLNSQIPKQDCQLNVYNFNKMKEQPPSEFHFLRFDPNNNCNLRCVYCHNHRSKEIIETNEFQEFLHGSIISVENFQVGCIMEPTLDTRVADLMLMIANSPARPSHNLILQTNGTLLDRHDHAKMEAAGLNRLSVSVDAAESETQRSLRKGANLDKIVHNVEGFRQSCPNIPVEFICTVTSANIAKLDGLVQLGLNIGVTSFVFREVFYYPDNDIVDHTRMPDLLLKGQEFTDAMERILDQFGTQATFVFAEETFLKKSAEEILTNSMRSKE